MATNNASNNYVNAASKADQESSTSNTVAVTPLIQQSHPSAAKAWVQYTTVTTTAITSSYNITSLTDNGTGDTTIRFIVPFATANYCVTESSRATPASLVLLQRPDTAPFDATPTAYRAVSVLVTTGAAVDLKDNMVTFFGDQ